MREYLVQKLNKHFRPKMEPLSNEALKAWTDGGLSLDRIVYYNPPPINPEQALPFVRQFSQFGTDLKLTRFMVHALVGRLWAMRLNTFGPHVEPISAERFIESWNGRFREGKSHYSPQPMNGGLSVAVEKDNSFPGSADANGRLPASRIEVARLEQIFQGSYEKDDDEIFLPVRGDLDNPAEEFTSSAKWRKVDAGLEAISRTYPDSPRSIAVMYSVETMEKLLRDTSVNYGFQAQNVPKFPINEAVVKYFKSRRTAFLLLHSTTTTELGRAAAEINEYFKKVIGGTMGPLGVRGRIQDHTPWLPEPVRKKMLKLYGEFESKMASYIAGYNPAKINDPSKRTAYEDAMERPVRAIKVKQEWDQFMYDTFYRPLCAMLWWINEVVPKKSREGATGEIFKLPDVASNDPAVLVNADNFPWLFPHYHLPWLDAHVHRYRREYGPFQVHITRFWGHTKIPAEDEDVYTQLHRVSGSFEHSDRRGS